MIAGADSHKPPQWLMWILLAVKEDLYILWERFIHFTYNKYNPSEPYFYLVLTGRVLIKFFYVPAGRLSLLKE